MLVASHVLALLLSPPPADDFAKAAAALAPRLIAMRRDIHRYPELPNREFRTGKLVADRLRALGLEVRHPVARTGVVAVLRGGRPGPAVALRADLDALPIQEERDTPYRSRHPGIMHACGHDAHTAVVVAVAELLAARRAELPGTVVFLFQPAEEGPPEAEEGGAALMIEQGALEDPRPAAILGFHVDPTLETGQVGWTDGTVFAGRNRFRIEVRGRLAHSAAPESGQDAIRAAAAIVQAVGDWRDEGQRPHVSIGTIRGGRHYNLVADEARLDGILRSLDADERDRIKKGLDERVRRTAQEHGTTATLRFLDAGTAPTVNDVSLARRLRPVLERTYGADHVLTVGPQMGSEDFSAYAERVPALYLRMGVRNEAKGVTAMTHTPTFDLDEAA
ncbi:MAG TPA: M20 family metallopeptidase, partial [Vicinamibacteria bacterium]|nr:M20 family metallopeptidase [Vicinamibacteria bacterium]